MIVDIERDDDLVLMRYNQKYLVVIDEFGDLGLRKV